MAETLVTLNAELLDDKDAFSYQDLRSLCKKLELGGNGKREVLVKRLREWHLREPVEVRTPASLELTKAIREAEAKAEAAVARAAVVQQRRNIWQQNEERKADELREHRDVLRHLAVELVLHVRQLLAETAAAALLAAALHRLTQAVHRRYSCAYSYRY